MHRATATGGATSVARGQYQGIYPIHLKGGLQLACVMTQNRQGLVSWLPVSNAGGDRRESEGVGDYLREPLLAPTFC